MTLSMTTGCGAELTGAAAAPDTRQDLAQPQRTACAGLERRRRLSGALAQPGEELEDRFLGRVARGPPELASGPPHVQDRDGEREVDPPWRARLEMKSPRRGR